MSGYKFKLVYSYSKRSPLQIRCRLTNMSEEDLYFCKYDTPWDTVSRIWEIKNKKGEKANYIGKMVSRIAPNVAPKAWIMLRKGKSTKIKDFTLRYALPFGSRLYVVKCTKKQISVCQDRTLVKGKIEGIEQADLEIVKKAKD